MDYLKILRVFLSNTYKMTDGEIDAFLSASEATEESINESLLAREKERVLELTKPKQGQTYQDGFKAAKKEVFAEFEKTLKNHFNIESDSMGLDLVNEIVTKSSTPGTTPEEEIKKSPAYLAMERDLRKLVKDKETEFQTKWDARDAEEKRGKTLSIVEKEALAYLEELQPVYSKNTHVAQTHKDLLIERLKAYDYDGLDVNDISKATILKDGENYKNDLGHVVTFKDLVKEHAGKIFEFAANNGGQNGGNGGGGNQNNNGGNQGGAGTYPAGVTKPKSFEELSTILQDRTIKLEDRQLIKSTWEAENQTGTP